ncbi:hypothetical protein KKI93_16635 [Xenorhabdus bovienii]|uniref:DUF3168 domain-containing protein n=1 Tax=Xenorhabdus bovienii str. Intermedium TaxID=1379677 RepID=A0A077QMN1_XENBV|nr:hypothetical protein [Xenorhabdus bovienii]MDE9565650.1 hypothetical protein [Xenorhabdus bovienii]CDH34819.1 conserved hypothetical protein [Xenorhabdus bovienii str. Intermedium]
MIEAELQADLTRLTGLPVYPLILPSSVLEGVTYQRISDAKFNSGLAATQLIEARFQISLILHDYKTALKLETKICSAWESVQHGFIGHYPVQTVTRGALYQNAEELTENRKRYRITRDFIFTFTEVADD